VLAQVKKLVMKSLHRGSSGLSAASTCAVMTKNSTSKAGHNAREAIDQIEFVS
jgi:hypothetical protein